MNLKEIYSVFLFFILSVSILNAQLPEGFEGNTFPPTGWKKFAGTNGLGAIEEWSRATINSHSGVASALIYDEDLSPSNNSSQDWLVTPLLSITASKNNLVFFEKEIYGAKYNASYNILVSTSSQTTIANFTSLVSYPELDTVTQALAWRKRVVDLSAYMGQSIYIAFMLEGNLDDGWNIDDISLQSSCGASSPTLTLNATTPISADISWVSNQTLGNYKIKLQSTTGTTTYSTTSASYSIASLLPGKEYTVSVQQQCSLSDTSDWSNVISFTTPCNIYNIPWSDGFEDPNTYACWFYQGDWLVESTVKSYARKPRTGSSYITTQWNAKDTLFSPGFNLLAGKNYVFSFYYASDDSLGWDSMAVMGSSQQLTNYVLIGPSIFNISDSNYVNYSTTFSVLSSGVYYMAVAVYANSNPWYFKFDDFSLTEVISTSVNTLGKDLDVLLYPNPTNDYFTLKITAAYKKATLELYDIVGQRVLKQAITDDSSIINLSTLPNGIYTYNVYTTEGQMKTGKIIKQ